MRQRVHYLERELHDLLASDAGLFEFLEAGSLDGVWYLDLLDPEHEWMSPRFWEVLGFDPAQREHRMSEWQELVHPDDLRTTMASLEAHLADPARAFDEVVRYRHADGHTVWIRCRGMAIRDGRGRPVRMLGAHNDLTALKAAEAELRARAVELEHLSARLRAVFDHSAIAAVVVAVDGRGTVLEANEAFDVLCGGRPAHLDEVLEAASAAGVLESLARVGDGDPAPVEVECELAVEPVRWVRLLAASVPDVAAPPGPPLEGPPGRSPAPTMVIQLEDVTQRRRALDRLRYLSGHDELTGLASRTGLAEHLHLALARSGRAGSCVGVILVDVDEFKIVNDALGHDVGDRVLVDVAARILRAVRSGDLVARLGGDEFAVLCEALDGDLGRARAELDAVAGRVLDAVTATVTLGEITTQLSASVGVRLAAAGSIDVATLLSDADAAMHRAKRDGRRRVVHHDPEIRRAVEDRLQLEHDLRRALRHGGVHVAYQPVIDLRTGGTVGAEALVRWQHPQLGAVPPTRFVPLAERCGLIGQLGERVALDACTRLATLAGWDTPGFRVAVNVAAGQLTDGDLAATLLRLLDGHGLRPEQLAVELTESVLMEATDRTVAQLDELDRVGVAIGIDDFGTGFGSLVYLQRFPVSFIKIDRSFVAGLGERDDDTAIVTAITDLGASLGLDVVAEGVEHPLQAQLLRTLGCPLAQGYHFGRPGPAEVLHPADS